MTLSHYLNLVRREIDTPVIRYLMMAQFPRVLSIQSHVVSGYVGNKSATFPLQILGFEVDTINSVQFCNHTGYAAVKGQVLTDKDLGDLVEGLATNNLDTNYSHLLTGYIGSPAFLKRVASLVIDLKAKNKELIYVCDPVMGDNGKMYVPAELLPIYKEVVIPLADILTPNQYEVELLTERKIKTVEDAWKSIDILHDIGCKTVFLSSSELGSEGNLLALASTIKGERKRVIMSIPKLNATFTGTGDLFASLLLAWMYSTDDIQLAMDKTMATIQHVLQKTLKYASVIGISTGSLELKLIQCKEEIQEPKVTVHSKLT
ncbi:PREDICTED: pyridoxal kinase [Nicrophorus vespilloides]|uniref:Pyridoxal kinase n=1 Tax=Nicrophorus vespilloides TaxID=110193 RepID=A0ABM1MPM3_NICVS|nr:PREDICTED: pyridoxal kinase [Nicrophorus vespilloides]